MQLLVPASRRPRHVTIAARAIAAALLLPWLGAAGPESPGETAGEPWRSLEPGLELGEFLSPQRSKSGDSIVRVLRIDPERFELRLLNASAPGHGELRTARGWCRHHGLVAAINASMYQTDYRRSVSLMKSREHVNNPRLSRDNAVLAFDRLNESVPPVQIIDRQCQDFDALGAHYGTLVQSIRMVSCDGKNVWRQQPKEWSTAAVGMDRLGRPLFIHVRSPYSTHDLIDILLALPLELRNAMYVEGGPEAQLYARAGEEELEFVGSFETGLFESDEHKVALPVPNVLGVVRRPPGAAEAPSGEGDLP